MYVRLNGQPLEEVDCFKEPWVASAADGGWEREVVHRINEGHRAWEALQSVVINRGLGVNAKKCLVKK